MYVPYMYACACVSPPTPWPPTQTQEEGGGGMTPEGGEAVMTNQVGPRGESVLSEQVSSSQHQELLQRIEDAGSFGHLWYVKYAPSGRMGPFLGFLCIRKNCLSLELFLFQNIGIL